MSNENVLLTQGGYFLPPSIGTYQPHPPLAPVNYYQAPVLHGVPGLDVFSRVVRSPSITENFSYVSLAELKALLPEDHPDEKIETGLLPDGRAYAPRSARKDIYCLFPGKSGYILYFTHHYFSRENLDRDQYIRGMMDNNSCVPMDVVIKAPRLASVNTTIEELTSAIETGSDILVHITSPDGKSLLRRRDGYPGPSALSNASSLLPADGSNSASFDGRAGISERPTPSASADPEVVPNLPAVPLQPVYGVQAAAPLDTSVIYPPPNAFLRPANRPNSVSASVATNPAITHLTATLTGMNLGQTPQPPPPTGNSHPPTQPTSQFFAPMSNFATAAAIAAINARNQNLAFTNPFAPNLFAAAAAAAAAGQGRPASSIHPSQHQQFFHHPQQPQQRRVSPPPPPHTTSAPPPNVSANVLNLQLPGAPLYNMHNIHEAGVSAHFAPGFPTQSYDSWLTDGANAALMNSNFHFQYASPSVMSGAPIMAWPSSQPPPPQIRSTSAVPPQHHQTMPLPYPQTQQPPNYQLFNVSNALTQATLGTAVGMNPTASVSTASPVVSTSVATTSNETSVSAKNAVTVMAGSIASSSASSSGKDEVVTSMASNAAVNEAPGPSNAIQTNSVSGKKPTANHQQQPPTQHSRPNSSGSNKGNKYKSGGKGGVQHHHHQRASLHANRGPGNTTLAPVSAIASTTTTVTSSAASNTVSSPPPAPSPPAPPTTTVTITTNK